MYKEKSDYNIQIVESAFDVLEQFKDSVEELGVTDLSRLLKIHKNKVYRLLATLESRNYIEQNKLTANYRLGLKNLQLGQTFLKKTGLLRHARPVIECISRQCNETSTVSVLDDSKVIYLDAVESVLPVRVVPQCGITFPFHCTAAGKVLAAYQHGDDLSQYVQSCELKRYTTKTITDAEQLTIHLKDIVEAGFAVNDEELNPGVTCVGAPVRDYTRHVIGAVSVSVPSLRLTSERLHGELIPLVRGAAVELSARLGYA